MIIEDESGQETIYQTEDQGPPFLPRKPPHPSHANPKGQPPVCNKDGCVGTLEDNEHELPHGQGSAWWVRIYDPSGLEPDDVLDELQNVPGRFRVRINQNRKLVKEGPE